MSGLNKAADTRKHKVKSVWFVPAMHACSRLEQVQDCSSRL